MAVVGGIIGGGIFRTPASVAERAGSVGLTLAVWITGGVVALAGAFCFGELGARRPRAGGGYVYLRETFGPLPAFLYGWTLLLVIATGAIAAVAVLFADYALPLLGLPDGMDPAGRGGQRGRPLGDQLSRRAARRAHPESFHRAQAAGAGAARRAWASPGRRRPPPRCPNRPRPGARSSRSARRWSRCSSPTAAGSRPTSSPRRSSSPSAPCPARWCWGW